MIREKIIELIKQGEGIEIEFKKSKTQLNNNTFETVCAFLNRNGGHILLGVANDGDIVGVDNPEKQILDFNTIANNPQKLNPSFYFSPEIIELDGKNILYIYIPKGSQVHKTAGKIFDRNSDGDFDITNNSKLVTDLYIRKQTTYSENTVFPYAAFTDLRSDLIDRVRKAAINEAGVSHPWSSLTNEELLKSAGLYQKDYKTGRSGLTLAAILLFGSDESILSALSHHQTDAILRIKDLDRYDDRDDIRTNLLESYDRLMEFVKKHLPDPFYIENETRKSIRNKVFREAVVNILIHREFINPFPAKMVIEKDKVLFENASCPHGYGRLTPESFSPFPKNPKIARVFKEIGLAEELGSGVRNLYRYSKIYSGKEPEIVEGDIFRIKISYPIHGIDEKTKGLITAHSEQLLKDFGKISERFRKDFGNEITNTYIELIKNPFITAKELAKIIGKTQRTIENYLNTLKDNRFIERKGPRLGGYWEILIDNIFPDKREN